MSPIHRLVFFLFFMAAAAPAAMASPSLESQRAWFYEAREALNAGDMEHYHRIYPKLSGYPLTPYLDLLEASKLLQGGNDLAVSKVLEKHADIPEATDLKIAWIRNLADRGQWPQVVEAMKKNPPVADRLPEIAMLSLWYTGKKDEALQRFSARWTDGYSVSDLSSRLHRKWQEAGHPTRDEVWQRLARFARRGNWKEVRALEKMLPESDRTWVAKWDAMQHHPLETLKQWPAGKPSHNASAMIADDGLLRLCRDDAAAAWQELHRLKGTFDPYRFKILERSIAQRGARQHIQQSAGWLSSLPDGMKTDNTRAWEVRIRLLYSEWFEALKAMKKLSSSEQQESRWSYWRARSLEALGMEEEARAYYEKTAKGRGYYSFLSAERLDRPYSFSASNFSVSHYEVSKLEKSLPMQRAHEWWLLGETGMALREWTMALGGASKERWKAAAELASKWQWYDRVIQAAYMSGEIDALDRRFPTAYKKVVADMSSESGLPSSLIWSIIRQESAFNAQAVSSSGAKGLMQLMPATAKAVANSNHVESPDLFNPDDNIKLGSLYLSELVSRFGKNHALAAAAYNAGPHRVSKWLERQPFDEADIWIESIPFEETRRYVQQVIAFTVVYDWRQEKKPAGIVTQINSQEMAKQAARETAKDI